jgi:uncharacterized protein
VLSGAFGIGGGIITTPAIRVLVGAQHELIAVGTPLPVIFPSAITGAWGYYKKGLLEVRVALITGLVGSVFAVLGALATHWVGGRTVLLTTAALILYTAGDMVLQVVRPPRLGLLAGEERDAAEVLEPTSDDPGPTASHAPASPRDDSARPIAEIPARPRGKAPSSGVRPPFWKLAAVGVVTGAYSGFLGLGGGFVLVPILTRWLHLDIKRAIGTSLMTIAILAVPGTITHAILGHVDWVLAAALIVGVVPGAWLGARITLGSSDRAVRIAFSIMLFMVGFWLAAAELGFLPS